MNPSQIPAVASDCPRCLKPEALCVCEHVKPLKTRVHVLILQHPQEPDKELGSARLAHLSLPSSTLKIGLSWRNLASALGREAQPQKWAVLYLGSGAKPAAAARSKPSAKPQKASGHGASRLPPLLLLDKHGVPLPDSEEILETLEGIVILDGTWSQAKTLWWRNAWLLKLRRAVISPEGRSLYGELRREPRRECLSTIESIAHALVGLGESPSVGNGLNALFSKLLDRKREMDKARRASRKPAPAAPTPKD